MNNFIIAGLFSEGVTDNRFLESVVKKALDDVAFDARGQIETELFLLKIEKTGKSFVEQVLEVSEKGFNEFGISILFVHTDSDNRTDETTFNSKIIPAKERLNSFEGDICNLLVPIIPIQMTEAWMLADKELLKNEIGTEKSDTDLGINKAPELFSDPKNAIEIAIKTSLRNETQRKRRHGLKIGELYQIVGQKLSLTKLEKIPSFLKFKGNLKDAFIELNLM